MRTRRMAAVSCAWIALAALAPRLALAEPAPLTAEQVKFAEHEYDLGLRASGAGKYDDASTHFENAFFTAPNTTVLRAAVAAHRKARHYARAATMATLGHRRFPDDPDTTKAAEAAIGEARPHVHEVTLVCASECAVVADTKVVTIDRAKDVRFFLDPGHHELTVGFGDERTKQLAIEARAGGSDTLRVEAPPRPAAPPPRPVATAAIPPSSIAPVASSALPSAEVPSSSRKPFGPAVFFTGVGLTAVGLGATIFSGLDAQKNPGRDAVLAACVGKGESCPEYQRGLDAQRRTNILIGVTGGVALLTTIVGAFLTQWSSPVPRPTTGLRLVPSVRLGRDTELGFSGSF